MATREARLAEFTQGIPKENRPLQILCEDQRGTYIIPYRASGQTARGGKLEALRPLKQL
jgi:hypothetical protein